jgi:hypothetical protein
LAAQHGGPCCQWRAAWDPTLCIVRIDEQLGGADSIAALSMDSQERCRTFQIQRGDTRWAVFSSPKGLVRRASARELAPGVSILSKSESFPIPPSKGCAYVNPGAEAEIEATPYWLQQTAFEPPDTPPGRAVPAPKPSPRPIPCRPTARFPQPNQGPRKGHPACNQAGWRRGGFRIYRQR